MRPGADAIGAGSSERFEGRPRFASLGLDDFGARQYGYVVKAFGNEQAAKKPLEALYSAVATGAVDMPSNLQRTRAVAALGRVTARIGVSQAMGRHLGTTADRAVRMFRDRVFEWLARRRR